MKIAVLGSGNVGDTLTAGLRKHGYEVRQCSRDGQKLDASFEQGARWADLVVLAVKGAAAESALDIAGLENLAGKTVIDTTNPIAAAPPKDGVLAFFTGPNDSLMERLQARAPEARFVKAFSCVGSPFMVDPSFPGGKPSMFICGDEAGAKAEVGEILGRFGWEIEDMGSAAAARAIEPLCMLWCIPGLRGGGWSHAFKLLKA